MSAYVPPALFLVAMLALFVAALRFRVKLRAIAKHGLGVSVYDFGADLELPQRLHSRSYQIAIYLTMKSLPREPAEKAAGRVNVAAASH
ncbi:MAG: hypothetical protein KGM15_17710 [Pseudomonadota bacterium]|nr:hypothetical protein [Pseudomonadota bacterium]